MDTPIRYFHGGQRGLAVGGYILPPAITKAWSTSDYVEAHGLHRKDRVYVTTDLTGAQLYASGHQDPIVYEVEPVGDLEDDPDCLERELSFACGKAKIVAIHKVPGKLIKKARKVILRRGQ